MSLISDRASEALVRAVGHHEAVIHQAHAHQAGGSQLRKFSIAISSETGTRGPAVARIVGERLGWSVYDRELLEIIARNLHVAVKSVENVDEHHVTWLQECVESFAAVPAVREQKFVCHLIEAMLSLSARGRCVIVGRGSPFVLPAATTLRVRLTAPLADRIDAICQERHLSRSDAARHIEQIDRYRTHFVKLHFQRDAGDVQHYDLMVNTSQFPIDECAQLIVNGLMQKSHAAARSESNITARVLEFAT
jgi:cytidylate kinase